MKAFLVLLLFFAIMSLIAFCMMGLDKSYAIEHKWRIPESKLFTAALFGGAIGGTLGMFYYHHKTRHAIFRIGFPILAALQIGILLAALIFMAVV